MTGLMSKSKQDPVVLACSFSPLLSRTNAWTVDASQHSLLPHHWQRGSWWTSAHWLHHSRSPKAKSLLLWGLLGNFMAAHLMDPSSWCAMAALHPPTFCALHISSRIRRQYEEWLTIRDEFTPFGRSSTCPPPSSFHSTNIWTLRCRDQLWQTLIHYRIQKKQSHASWLFYQASLQLLAYPMW